MTVILFAFLEHIFSWQEDSGIKAAELIKSLRSEVISERDNATRKLKEMGVAAVPMLVHISGDKDLEVAGRAAAILLWITLGERLSSQVKEKLPNIVDRLSSGTKNNWSQSFLDVLGICKGDLTLQKGFTCDLEVLAENALKNAFAKEDKIRIIETIADLRLKTAIGALVIMLKDLDSDVRGCAALALGILDVSGAVPQILTLLNENIGSQRDCAVRALGLLKAREAIPALSGFLINESNDLRYQAVISFDWIGDIDACKMLLPLLKDKDFNLRASVCRSLGNLGDSVYSQDLVACLDDDQEYVQSLAAQALGSIGERSAIPKLLDILGNSDGQAAVGAAQALGMLNSEKGRVRLIAALQSKNPSLRIQAAESLCKIGDLSGVPLLLEKSISLCVLNSLRDKSAWDDLIKTRIHWYPKSRSIKDAVEELALIDKLAVEWPAESEKLAVTPVGPVEIGVKQPVVVWIDRLLPVDFTFIIEGHSIRIILKKNAIQFWREWWNKRSK